MIVSEGLAENFTTYLYGEEKAGPWVGKTDMEALNKHIKLRCKGIGTSGGILEGSCGTLGRYGLFQRI